MAERAARRLLVTAGILTVYRGWRAFVKKLRRKVLVLSPDQARTLSEMVTNNLTVLIATDDQMKLAVRLARRTKEMD